MIEIVQRAMIVDEPETGLWVLSPEGIPVYRAEHPLGWRCGETTCPNERDTLVYDGHGGWVCRSAAHKTFEVGEHDHGECDRFFARYVEIARHN